MSDLKLDTVTGDLVFVEGDLVLTDGVEALTQRVTTSLRMFLGEAFESPLEGVPYFQQILIKNPQIPALTTLFRRAILLVDGISEVIGLTVDFNSATRTVSISFSARGELGELVTFTDFIIDV